MEKTAKKVSGASKAAYLVCAKKRGRKDRDKDANMDTLFP